MMASEKDGAKRGRGIENNTVKPRKKMISLFLRKGHRVSGDKVAWPQCQMECISSTPGSVGHSYHPLHAHALIKVSPILFGHNPSHSWLHCDPLFLCCPLSSSIAP